MYHALFSGALPCWNMLDLGPLLRVKENHNATGYEDMLDNNISQTSQQTFEEGPHIIHGQLSTYCTFGHIVYEQPWS